MKADIPDKILIITITMDIDESTHNAKVSRVVTEDGIEKTEWTLLQVVSTSLVLMEEAKRLLEDLNNYILNVLRKEEQK